MRTVRILLVLGVAFLGFASWNGIAEAHPGGLDDNGGHHCREAGYNSGKCAPLDSYHCHQAPCGQTASTEPPAQVTTATTLSVAGQATTPTTAVRSPTAMADSGPREIGIASGVGAALLLLGWTMRGKRALGGHYHR